MSYNFNTRIVISHDICRVTIERNCGGAPNPLDLHKQFVFPLMLSMADSRNFKGTVAEVLVFHEDEPEQRHEITL